MSVDLSTLELALVWLKNLATNQELGNG
jgi:hypothetical protein